MGTLIGKVKNNPLEEAVNQMSGTKYFFETPMVGYRLIDEPIFCFKPLPLSNSTYNFKLPLKEYIKVEELYEVTEEEEYDSKKYLNITFLQPFTTAKNNGENTEPINPHLFIYFDYLKENLGISKIVFNIDADKIGIQELTLYPGGLNTKNYMVKLSDFQLHINNIGTGSTTGNDNSTSINLCNVNELKNVNITSNTPDISKLGGVRWRFAFNMDSNKFEYRDLYLNSDFIMSHKNNLNNHTNCIPGGIPITIDCDFDSTHFKFEDETENGFLYNFFKQLYKIDKVNYPCLVPDFLPQDIVMNINNKDKYFLYMTQTSSKRFISVEDEIKKLESMGNGGIKWKCYKEDKYFRGDLFYYKLFFGINSKILP